MKTKSILFLSIILAFVSTMARADDAVEPPVPVRTVPPHYPEALRRDGIAGVVTVSCTIDERGNVTEPKVVKASSDAFADPAIEALSKWKFKPAKKGGNAIPIKVSFPIQFNVGD
jgi:protein TonB